jgi:hypothetical protein
MYIAINGLQGKARKSPNPGELGPYFGDELISAEVSC